LNKIYSTPRPKRAEKVKLPPKVVSIMASLSTESHHRYTQRENQASESHEALELKDKALCDIEKIKRKYKFNGPIFSKKLAH
jgi:hypothetical protein